MLRSASLIGKGSVSASFSQTSFSQPSKKYLYPKPSPICNAGDMQSAHIARNFAIYLLHGPSIQTPPSTGKIRLTKTY